MDWFYSKQGERLGPVDREALQALIAKGEVVLSDLVWREGMDKWLPVREVLELSTMPPVPASSPPGAPPVAGVSPLTEAIPAGGGEVPVAEPERDPNLPTIEPPPPTSGLAVSSMVCGMLAIFFCGAWALFGIPAVICGHMAIKRIKLSELPMEGRGMAVAGLATGYLGIIVQVAFLAFVLIGLVTGGGKS